MPLLSIVTISLNCEVSIAKTLNSVLTQSFLDFEYILIDGGSSDNTVEVANSFSDEFRRLNIRFDFCSERDNGISNAFNKGIAKCSGDFVLFLNSGDWLNEGSLDFFSKSCSDDFDLYSGNLDLYDVVGNYVSYRKTRPYLLSIGMYVNHPSFFFRKNLLLRYCYDETLKIVMDYDLILRLHKLGYKIKKLDYTISSMSLGGISSSLGLMRMEEKNVIYNNSSAVLYSIYIMKIFFEDNVFRGVGKFFE